VGRCPPDGGGGSVSIKELATRAYVSAFGVPRMQKVNHALYHVALRGMGYNNGWQLPRSGEEWFIRHVLAPSHPRSCLDVGANAGEYTKALLRWTSAEVHAFEPLPGAFRAVEEIARTSGGRVTVNNCAVGAEDGTATLHYGDDMSEHASLSTAVNAIDYVGASNTLEMEVKVTSIDSYFARGEGPATVDFIKIDTEGYEQEVLMGAQETVKEHAPRFIQIEMNLHQLMRGQSLWGLSQLLPDYDVFQMVPRGMCKVDPKRPEANTFCFANFCFVRR